MVKAIFIFVAILFLIIYQEFASASSDDFVVLVFATFLNIPTIVALFVLISFAKLNKIKIALIVNSLIWLPYALYVGNAASFDIKNSSALYRDLFDNAYGIMFWLPIMIVYALTLVVYFINKNKSIEYN